MSRSRPLAALLALVAVLTAAEPGPLPESGPDHAAVVHALQRLSQGDPAALLTLPDSALTTPPALPDPARPELALRWTTLIPWSDLAPGRRKETHELLIKRIHALRPQLEDDLGTMMPDGSSSRWSFTTRSSRPGSPGLPGWPQPISQATLPSQVLRQADRYLVAVIDSLPLWQIALDPGARVWTSPQLALVAGSRGLRWVGLEGDSHTLPPFPPDVSVLGCDGGAAFFARGTRGWRLELLGSPWRKEGDPPRNFAAEHPEPIELGEEPLGAPLAGDLSCLWLTMHHLVWWDGHDSFAYQHGLPVGRGWRLARDDGGRPLILAPDGRCWTVPAYRSSDPATDERLGRFADLEARKDLPPPFRFRAALRHRDRTAAGALAAGGTDLAALALYLGSPPPAEARDLAALPRDPAELALPEQAWSGGIAPRARPEALPAPPAGRDHERPLADAAEPWPEPAAPARTRAGLALGLRTWSASDDGERAEAVCRDDGAMRWFARWLPEPALAAPARSLALADGGLLIGEGDARLLVFDAATGAPLLDLRPRHLPVLPGRTWLRLRPDGVAGAVVLHPPGLDDRLGWIARDGGERSEHLPQRARWLLCLPDGECWLCLADGSALRRDDREGSAWSPITLPAGLTGSDTRPRLVDGGVAADGRRWKWR